MSYSVELNIDCFDPGAVLTDVNDILSIYVNMEHSYSGDLDMFITAPNGVQVQLFAQTGGSTWFGEAVDNDATATQGFGYDYGWSMNPSYSGTMAEGMASGNTIAITLPYGQNGITLSPDIYLPLESFNALLGSPLNGAWNLTIIDNLVFDNGWVFLLGSFNDPKLIFYIFIGLHRSRCN